MTKEQTIEIMARAVVYADEQNGGPPWDMCMTMGKHTTTSIYDRANATYAALESAGLVIVPHEPTEQMVQAGIDSGSNWYGALCCTPRSCWAAMITAIPSHKGEK